MGWDTVGATKTGDTEKVPYVKLPEGKTTVRILDEAPKSYWKHWIPGLNRSVLCLGTNCPVCEIRKKDLAEGKKSKFNVSRVHAINVLNRGTNEVEVLEKGNSIFEDLKSINQEVGDLRTFDVTIIRKGTGMNDTKYTILPCPAKPLTAEEQAMKPYDLDAINVPMSHEDLVKALGE
jgi:hypothetical protein